jgi:hypothetical protein
VALSLEQQVSSYHSGSRTGRCRVVVFGCADEFEPRLKFEDTEKSLGIDAETQRTQSKHREGKAHSPKTEERFVDCVARRPAGAGRKKTSGRSAQNDGR